MTRPTKEQIDALKPGDRVLVEATINYGPDGDGDWCLTTEYAGGRNNGTQYVRREAIHSILPREIKVGDRVRDTGGTHWEVVAGPRRFRGDVEFALWSEARGFGCGSLKGLTVIA